MILENEWDTFERLREDIFLLHRTATTEEQINASTHAIFTLGLMMGTFAMPMKERRKRNAEWKQQRR